MKRGLTPFHCNESTAEDKEMVSDPISIAAS